MTWKRSSESRNTVSKEKSSRLTSVKQILYAAKHKSSVKSDPVKWPCSICRKSVGINLIFCQSCNHWVYKRCSKIKGRLKADPSFQCNACTNKIMAISQDDTKLVIGNDMFEEVDSFHYLDDSIGQSGSCFEATADRMRTARNNFRSLLPVLRKSSISLEVRDMHKIHVLVVSFCILVKLRLLK